MDAKLIKNFLAFMQGNGVSTDYLLDYNKQVAAGELHFQTGVHFPVPVHGIKADAVYVDNYSVIKDCESEKALTLSRAEKFCKKHDCLMPSPEARMNMLVYRDAINVSLRTLGYPILHEGGYWAKGDSMYYVSPELDDPDDGFELAENYVRGTKYASDLGGFHVEKDVSPNGYVLKELLQPEYSYREYLEGLGSRFPKAGWYLLNDGSFSQETVYDNEKGIVVTPNLCLNLNMHAMPMTAVEADAYSRFYGSVTPTTEQLLLLQKYAPQINAALDGIDMEDMHIPEYNIEERCWSHVKLHEHLCSEKKSTKELLYLPIYELQTVPEVYDILAELL